MTMIAVDLWAEQPESDAEGSEAYADGEWKHEAKYQNLKALADTHFDGRLRIIREHTVRAADRVPDGSLDFVFIDADHTYTGCKNDIKAWTPKVRKGGLIAGHDYNWPSVKKAVDEMFPLRALSSDNVWFDFKPALKRVLVK